MSSVKKQSTNFFGRGGPNDYEREIIRSIQEAKQKSDDNRIQRAVASALRDELLHTFMDRYEVDEPTGGAACLYRLKNTSGRCTHGMPQSPSNDQHAPPLSDHCELWLANGEPAVYVSHEYEPLSGRRIADMVDWCNKRGYRVEVEAESYYYPTRTVMFVITHDDESKRSDP